MMCFCHGCFTTFVPCIVWECTTKALEIEKVSCVDLRASSSESDCFVFGVQKETVPRVFADVNEAGLPCSTEHSGSSANGPHSGM